jgi:hypothetical protein
MKSGFDGVDVQTDLRVETQNNLPGTFSFLEPARQGSDLILEVFSIVSMTFSIGYICVRASVIHPEKVTLGRPPPPLSGHLPQIRQKNCF